MISVHDRSRAARPCPRSCPRISRSSRGGVNPSRSAAVRASIRSAASPANRSTASEYVPRSGGSASGQTDVEVVCDVLPPGRTKVLGRRPGACRTRRLAPGAARARDAVVRLAENELPEQAHRDEQQGRADERDQQLRPDLDRQAGDGPDERIAGPSPPVPRRPAALLLGQDLRPPGRSFRRPCS